MSRIQPAKENARPTAAMPSRGNVLCIITDPTFVDRFESVLVKRGFTLTRARHGMHGYWLAVTAQPDVIVTDVISPEESSNYLLDCLNRNQKTSSIPIVAVLDSTHQSKPGVSCLRRVASSFLKSTPPEALVEQLDKYVAESRPESTGTTDYETRFDAVFAELGHMTPKAPWSVESFPNSGSSTETDIDDAHPIFNSPHIGQRQNRRSHLRR